MSDSCEYRKPCVELTFFVFPNFTPWQVKTNQFSNGIQSNIAMAIRRKQYPATTMQPVAAAVAFTLLIAFQVTAQSAVDCPNAPGLEGYTSIAAINADMQTELSRIRNGGLPEDSYTFTMCPNLVFDTSSVALLPVLSNSMFVCGEMGDVGDDCVLFGGDEQIRIEDSTVSGYVLERLTFAGLTFADFGGTSIAALASSTTSATFTNSLWTVSYGVLSLIAAHFR
jgi:hypothetical protein